MIRFCDKEINCIDYTSLTRSVIEDYFLPNHKEDVLYVYDAPDTMRYEGFITYDSYQRAINIGSTIQRDSVVIGTDMWQDARKYFTQRAENMHKDILLPVLDKEHRLVCFAYEDKDADREIRMLRELLEISDALQFTDLYPEYQCVKIYEFNELAYFFAKYLEQQKVAVETIGTMWQSVFEGTECQVPDYKCMSIYAEGVDERKRDCLGNVLRSASVEFECIDRIYEANIKAGIVKDTKGDYAGLLEYLKNKEEIIIIGTNIRSINACDLLLSHGIDIFCFLSDDRREQNYQLFGKKVLSEHEIKKQCVSPIFLECLSENSAWGFGEVDRFDYMGYRRNEQYFLLKDYTEIRIGNLQSLLNGKNVILIGNIRLCDNVSRALREIEDCFVTYWDILEEYPVTEIRMALTDEAQINENTVCLLIEPEYYSDDQHIQLMRQKKRLYLERLKEKGINNVTDYFSDWKALIYIQKKNTEKYTIPSLTPKKILLDIGGHMSGKNFFMNLLDGHPNILMVNVEIMYNNLFLMCMELAEEKSENILTAFWKIFDRIRMSDNIVVVRKKDMFNEKFEELLAYKDSFTSQELFSIFHIVYAKVAWGWEIQDVQDRVIYWGHIVEIPRENCTHYEEWLSSSKVEGLSITLTRNAYSRLGSLFKCWEGMKVFSYSGMKSLWDHMEYAHEREKMPVLWKERFQVKFETLKTSPRETLGSICDKLEIPWDDSLMETTWQGKMAEYPYSSSGDKISGFDLRPVYDLYERYFSEFDRFRINMIFARAQRTFNYPYVSCSLFSRRELLELFLKEFGFEDRLLCEDDSQKAQFRKDMIDKVRDYLQRERREESVGI